MSPLLSYVARATQGICHLFLALGVCCLPSLFSPLAYSTEDRFFDDLGQKPTLEENRNPTTLQNLRTHKRGENSAKKPLFSYGDYFKDVQPDLSALIGEETVKRWSRKLLHQSEFPIRYLSYELVKDALDFSVTLDYQYFKTRKDIDLLSPTFAPGEIFKPIEVRKPYEKSSRDLDFVVDLRFRLRFPLLDYEESGQVAVNTVFMGFSRQAVQAYYLQDFELYLKKSETRASLLEEASGLQFEFSEAGGEFRDVLLELSRLEENLESGTALTPKDLSLLEDVEVQLDTQEIVQGKQDQIRELEAEITRFRNGSILPIVISAHSIRELFLALNANKNFGHYLRVEIVDFQDQAAGVLKVSNLNRVIEEKLPGLDIYFVGVKQIKTGKRQEHSSKIFVAARLRKEEEK
jgi:hypothetical protein